MDSEENKQAWDDLYRGTDGSVWGAKPVPFVEEFVEGLDLSENSRLLDAAAGDGRHVPVLLEAPGVVHACDASPHAMVKLQRFDGTLQRFECDLARTPFENDYFDFVSLIDTIETLPEPQPALAEVYRILKPGGKLLCNIPGEEDDIAGEEMKPDESGKNSAYVYQDSYFYRFYEEREALEMVRRCGFEVVRNETRHWEEGPHPGFREYPHEHTSRVLLLAKPRAGRNGDS